jgi:hypothetical protein
MNIHGEFSEPARWRAAQAPPGSSMDECPLEEENAAAGGGLPGIHRLSIFAGLGALLILMAWLLPAHWKSLAPTVVEYAGRGTATLGGLGLSVVAAEKPGPASLILTAAQSLRDPQAAKLAADLADLNARKPELRAWGGENRLMPSVLLPGTAPAKAAGEPVLQVFLTESTRVRLRQHLSGSRSPGAQAILQTRDLTNTTRFVPAMQPGGQPFEATILLMGLLYENDRVALPLVQEIKSLADKANAGGETGEWESACLDMLALGKRLDWTQLVELLHFVPDLKTMAALARVSQDTPERFSIVYSASLLMQSAQGVAQYLARFEQHGPQYLAKALAAGDGAVRLLLGRQLPVGPEVGGAMAFLAPLVLRWPELALGLKFSGFVLAILCFYLVWNELAAGESAEGLSLLSRALRWRRAVVAVLLAMLLVAASEPFLLPGVGSPYQFRLNLPTLSNSPIPKNENLKPKTQPMNLDTSTILSVALFAALQVIVYAICLLKIREISRQSSSPRLKLKLMENEENLFDSGLYVGIAGTAAALILQVLGFIEANLLAAYASNLFGILCVALVKIRHVRAYKRKLILQSRASTSSSQPLAEAVA